MKTNTANKVRNDIRTRLDEITIAMNEALSGGKPLKELKGTLKRLGRGGKLPHWYSTLERKGTLPNLDGKSLGSVIEMVFVAILEQFYHDTSIVPLQINPARGVDIPTLKLGVKSPSKNYNTSEPFFSAYERLLGNEHDAVILLTNYQKQKAHPPLHIQIINHAYLSGSQIADKNLCAIAKKHRQALLRDNISELKKIFRFLAYINQSDWEAKALLGLLSENLDDDSIDKQLKNIEGKFIKANTKKEKKGKTLLSDDCLSHLIAIRQASPRWLAVVNAADNWTIETQKDFGRYPNDSEWERFLRSDLDGLIGMSFALQWRYNFGPIFRSLSQTPTSLA